MGLFKWMGRMILWLFMWPIGLWRSLRHARTKGQKKAVKEVRKMAERGEL